MEKLLLPNSVSYEFGDSPNKGSVVILPFHQGYGTTIGNALRRVLLSSLPGSAVTAVKIKNVPHEFTAIEHVKEDIVEILLNLKRLRLKVFSPDEVRLSLHAKGEGPVTAKSIVATSDVDIANKDLVLCTLTDSKAEIEMEIFAAQGRGYVPAEERKRQNLELGTVVIDAIFTPVRDVAYTVEFTRVGEVTNYEKLILSIETDGTIAPTDALKQATQILMDHFSIIMGASALESDGAMSETARSETMPGETGAEAASTEEAAPKKRGRKKKESTEA